MLADVAARLHAERVAKYPAAVASSKLTQDAADSGIRIMHAVAAQWRAYVARHSEPERCACCGGASYREQRDTLIAASARCAQIAAKDPINARKAEYAAAVAALLWHAENALAAERQCWTDHAQAV
jgi:hypothetical protein